MLKRLSFGLMLLTAGVAQARLISETVDYQEGRTPLEGILVADDSTSGPRPAVVVIPDWMGPSDFSTQRANDLARMGYVVMVADIYGKGVRPKDAQEASQQSSIYKGNRPLMRLRARAALTALLKHPLSDSSRVAVVGYCFGGTAALELARSGAPLTGVVVFHGGLDTPTPQDAKKIKAKVIALQGADDPYVPTEQVAAFEKEMTEGGVDWQIVKYSGAVHSFTNPAAGADNSKGAAYNAKAAKRSWQAMKNFFAEIFQ